MRTERADHWISRCPACGALSELPVPVECGECGVPMVDALRIPTEAELVEVQRAARARRADTNRVPAREEGTPSGPASTCP